MSLKLIMQKIIKAQFGTEMQYMMSSFNSKNKDDQERGISLINILGNIVIYILVVLIWTILKIFFKGFM